MYKGLCFVKTNYLLNMLIDIGFQDTLMLRMGEFDKNDLMKSENYGMANIN